MKPEILIASDLGELPAALASVQRNENLAVVYTVTDAAANGAVDYAHESGYMPLVVERLPDEFSEALKLSHNSSHHEKLGAGPLDAELYASQRGATGMHIDGYAHRHDRRRPLTVNFICSGEVEAGFVPITEDEMPDEGSFALPERLKALVCDLADPGCTIDEREKKFMPRDVIQEMGKVITVKAGQLIFHSGYGEKASGRLPVPHQFISLGATVEERNQRTSAFIRTDELRIKEN